MSDLWLARIAANYTAILGRSVTTLNRDDPSQAGYDGFRVKTADGYHADIFAMLVNWRFALTPVNTVMPVPERYWCFSSRDSTSLALAMGNAATWNGKDDWRPTGSTLA